jgi:hypothetical protein
MLRDDTLPSSLLEVYMHPIHAPTVKIIVTLRRRFYKESTLLSEVEMPPTAYLIIVPSLIFSNTT